MKENKYLHEVYIANKELIDNPTDYRVHNWGNYIPDDLRSGWINLSNEAKAAVFLCCEARANNEEWD